MVTTLESSDLNTYLRPEVREFAREMEARLRANEHKGGWKNDSPLDLLQRVLEETEELRAVVREIRDNGLPRRLRDNVWAEAADVGNFAMMVADTAIKFHWFGKADHS